MGEIVDVEDQVVNFLKADIDESEKQKQELLLSLDNLQTFQFYRVINKLKQFYDCEVC